MSQIDSPFPGVILRPGSREDLRGIFAYLFNSSPTRAEKFVFAAQQTMKNLVEMPHMGSPRAVAGAHLRGLRVWPVKDFKAYSLFYRPLASNDGVEIIRVLHHSRDFETLLTDETEAV